MAGTDYEEELKKERRLVGSLVYEINYRKEQLSEMEHKYNQTNETLQGLKAKLNSKDSSLRDWEVRYNETVSRLTDENAALHEELQKEKDELRKEKSENFKLKSELRRQTKELDKSSIEQIDALNKKLEETKEALKDMENCYINLTVKQVEFNRELQDASEESINGLISSKESSLRDWELRYNENVRQLTGENVELRYEFAEAIRKEKAESLELKFELQQRTKELEDHKSRNEMDLERRSLLSEMEVPIVNVPCSNLVEHGNSSSKQIEALNKELEEAKETLKDMESCYRDLMVKQVQTNRELQDAREESIKGLIDILNGKTTLGIKRMGEIDQKAFEIACSSKFPNEDWRETCAKLCSLWQENVQDSKWYPYKMIEIRGNLQQIVDEDDEKLKELRNEYGNAVFDAVSTALMETNEYNASGRYPVPEVWNRKEERKATMKEIVEYIIRQLKTHKGKGKRKRADLFFNCI